MSWNALCPELRRLVWSFVADETVNATPGDEISRPWGRNRSDVARCARVNSEWRDFFEEALFQNLFLTQDTYPCLHITTLRQRRLVRYIWLRIEISWDFLGGRWYIDCQSPSATKAQAGLHILKFLRILSYWRPDELGTPDGLTIEISFYAPEDASTVFRNDLFFDSSPFTADVDPGGRRPLLTATRDGMVNGKRCEPLTVRDLTHLFYSPISVPYRCHNSPTIPPLYYSLLARLSLNPPSGLPPSSNLIIPPMKELEPAGDADVVTRLVIRRQSRRHIESMLMGQIMSALPELKSMTFEPWREWGEGMKDWRYGDFLDSVNDRMQDLQIFEDFNEEYDQIIDQRIPWSDGYLGHPLRVRTHSNKISELLVRRSLKFRRLAASYMIDAFFFFRLAGVDETLRWEKLESLQLTSHRHGMHDTERPESEEDDETNETLRLAGRAALRMPRLTKLDIWFAQRGSVFCFSYRLSETAVSIQWKGTRELRLDEHAVAAWSRVADLRSDGRYTLTVLPSELIEADDVNSHATGIKMLGLGDDMLHPVSLQQISHETERYFFGLESTQEIREVRAEQRAAEEARWAMMAAEAAAGL